MTGHNEDTERASGVPGMAQPEPSQAKPQPRSGDLWEKIQAQQAANRKLHRKYETVKGDLRVQLERVKDLEQELAFARAPRWKQAWWTLTGRPPPGAERQK